MKEWKSINNELKIWVGARGDRQNVELEILNGDAAESFVIDPFNAGDSVTAGMPDPLFGNC